MEMNAEAAGGDRNPAAPLATVAVERKKYVVYTIVEFDERSVWRRVGYAWVNRDGSYNLYLDALPVNGRLHMREVERQQALESER